MLYKEHLLSKKLKDNQISDYKAKQIKNTTQKILVNIKKTEADNKYKKISWDTF